MLILLTALLALPASDPIHDETRLTRAVHQAIINEIEFVNSAVKRQDMDRYMSVIPDDYHSVGDDGAVTDKAGLRALQTQALALIRRTNSIDIKVIDLRLGCGSECAFVKTDQRWDRQMAGKDGVSEFNVVTTQKHNEKWELKGSRWLQTMVEELGRETFVDGRPY